MDIADTLTGKSDQLDNVDLIGGPRTFTITKVEANSSDEQPVNIHLAEYPRVWRPGLTVRRTLMAVWGSSKDGAYEGRRVMLYRDPDVKFGNDVTGGTRISNMSHIDKPVTVSLPKSKGRFATVTIQPLTDSPAPATPPESTEPTAAEVAACDDADVLRDMWKSAKPAMRKVIEARVAEIGGAA